MRVRPWQSPADELALADHLERSGANPAAVAALRATSKSCKQPTAASIEYEVTLRVVVPAGQPDDAPRPFEEPFYADLPALVKVTRARRLTVGVAYGGPR